MHRISAFALATALLAVVSAAPAFATPLDPTGEDTGFVPPGQNALKCERYMNKRVTLAANCVLQCHIKNAEAILKNLPFDDDVCEDSGPKSCKFKYDKSLTHLAPGLCPPCMDSTTQQSLYTNYRDLIETNVSGPIFCDPVSSVPFGADDSGGGSTQQDVSKCEVKFARNVVKLIKCINLHCHRALADDLFAGGPNFNEPACEETDPIQSCKARFDASNTNLVGCPTCLDPAHRAALFDIVEPALDSRNGLVYCAQ